MNEEETIQAALAILETRMQQTDQQLAGPADAARYAMLKLSTREAEVFGALFLNTRHRVIEFREMFYGTIDGAAVYPREVVRAVMDTNAAALILIHNHPSGSPEPSEADRHITSKLADALALIDVRVLDHIVVGGTDFVSLAERGWV